MAAASVAPYTGDNSGIPLPGIAEPPWNLTILPRLIHFVGFRSRPALLHKRKKRGIFMTSGEDNEVSE